MRSWNILSLVTAALVAAVVTALICAGLSSSYESLRFAIRVAIALSLVLGLPVAAVLGARGRLTGLWAVVTGIVIGTVPIGIFAGKLLWRFGILYETLASLAAYGAVGGFLFWAVLSLPGIPTPVDF